MQSAQTAKVINGLQAFTDLAIMAMLKDASQHLADTQRRVAILQGEIDRRIQAGSDALKAELEQSSAAPTPQSPAEMRKAANDGRLPK
jgi:hypothetical protein